MRRRSFQPLFLAALSLSALTSCHIHNGGMDFSPLTARFEPVADDDVVLEGDTVSISTPIATPPDVAMTGSSVNAAPPVPAPTVHPTPSEPFAVAQETKPRPDAPAAAGASYVVKPGDTLSGIARRSHVTVGQLCAANKLSPATPLKVGQALRLPAAGGIAAAAPTVKPSPAKPAAKTSGKARTHTVQSGETLYAVARKYGVSPAALMQANKLTPQTAGKLRIGSSLTIPAKS